MEATFVIVGGGIAGVSCAETLAFLQPAESVILLSESSLIKTVTNLHAITRTLTDFNIEERQSNYLSEKYENVSVIHDTLQEIEDEAHTIITENKLVIKYRFLCLCMGAQPRMVPQSQCFPQYVMGIRDTNSVEEFVEKLKNSKKVVVVGNGGIASEVVYKIDHIETDWVIKDKHISATFVDPGAAEFLRPSLQTKTEKSEPIRKRMRYEEESESKSGAALGPDWYENLTINGSYTSHPSRIRIHYQTEISSIQQPKESSDFPIEVTLTSRETIACDLVVSATGVSPRQNFKSKNAFYKSEDGGLQVDEFMKTSLGDIYAAGDICNANWIFAKHWFQMKLWTQARQMGTYAAKSMSGHFQNEAVLQDFCFEMFSHSTKLFGFKLILLGLYNGQKLGNNYEILLRMTKSREYVKFVLEDNKLQGVVLIGDTNLEEMCENLILNQLDLSPYGDDILNPDIDIDDYFD